MRPPKRVPWTDISELEQLCSWVYSEDTSARVLAVNRLAAWKANTALPHALESILSLLIVVLEDDKYLNGATQSSSSLNLRQSYALALIRLVNGLVDPLQQGAYARPIANLAAQVGLPLWLVELRHASTHEDLPSLELLRDGAKQGMSWLLHNYVLSTLSLTTQKKTAVLPLRHIAPLLAHYKQLQKTLAKDVSLKLRLSADVSKALRELDQWISEARLAASFVALGPQSSLDEEDDRYQWALEQLSEALIARGGLVPISKRKRPAALQNLCTPTKDLLDIWSPLLIYVQSHHPLFLPILLHRILDRVLPSPDKINRDFNMTTDQDKDVSTDHSYDYTLSCWAIWIVENCCSEGNVSCSRDDVIKEILLSLRNGYSNSARVLLHALSQNDRQRTDLISILCSLAQPSGKTGIWDDNALQIMSERLSVLKDQLAMTQESSIAPEDGERTFESQSSQWTDQKLRGWRILSVENGWKPCPIGVNGLNTRYIR